MSVEKTERAWTTQRYFNVDIIIAIIGVLLIVYLWISSHIYVLIPWTEQTWNTHKVGWIIFYLVLHSLLFMSFWSFIMAAFTNPGEVAHTYRPLSKINGDGGDDGDDDGDDVRYCEKCKRNKPPRAHHCSHGCDRCILKMDHHCPWIAGCVGYRNHGHFFRYVVYTWSTALLAEIMLIWRVGQMLIWPETIAPGKYQFTPMMPIRLREALFLLFNTIFLGAVLVVLGVLMGITIRNVLTNCTTVEHLELEAEINYAERHKTTPAKFPFNLGAIENLKVVLGKRKWAWPLPLPSSWQLANAGDGFDFSTRPGQSQHSWPPVQYCSSSSSISKDSEIGKEKKDLNHDHNDHEEDDKDDEPLNQLMLKDIKSDPDLRYRRRRDSEGVYILPSRLSWHSETHIPEH